MSENIETLLKKLDITESQLGCSTGSNWFANGDKLLPNLLLMVLI